MEWSENVADALEPDTVFIDIRRGVGPEERIITGTAGSLAARCFAPSFCTRRITSAKSKKYAGPLRHLEEGANAAG